MWQEKRSSARHVIELPIRARQVQAHKTPKDVAGPPPEQTQTQNFSEGGLQFLAAKKYPVGATLELTFRIHDKSFTMKGRVAHRDREEKSGLYKTGISFSKPSEVFKVKMAEQLYQIDRYRKSLSRDRGSDVSEEEAAQLWIRAHSADFAEFYR
jgi:c-di-GMP-binding flagellar brake protein YcgR